MQFIRDSWPQPGNCFVMMPFGEKELSDGTKFNWDLHYEEVLAQTIQEAEMTPIRADGIYGPNLLLERVWQGIQQAEIVIADLTGRSPNVLYEVGLAHVIGKRILILTMDPEDVPVDLSEFVQIQYSPAGRGLLHFRKTLINNLQAARKEPTTEKMLTPLPGPSRTEKVPAKILHVTSTFAAVEAKDGRRGFLNVEDFSWTRKPKDLSKVLQVGKELNGAFVSDLSGEMRYSLTALEENPWPRLEKDFPLDSVFRGVVANYVPGIGAFVEMKYRIRGMVPDFQLPRDIRQGSELRAQVEQINVERREVRLKFVELVSPDRSTYDGWGPFYRGQAFEGRIRKVQPEQYVLVQITDNVTGLLPASKMSPLFRSRFLGSDLKQGDYVPVEVVDVDDGRRRVVLRDRRGEGTPPVSSPYQETAEGPANYEEGLPA